MARLMMQNLIDNIIAETLKNQGTTTKLDGTKPEGGYMVALSYDYETRLSLENFQPELVARYIDLVSGVLQDAMPNYYIGTWKSGDTVYLDVSQRVETLEEAIKLGTERNQLAIFDLNNMKEIEL